MRNICFMALLVILGCSIPVDEKPAPSEAQSSNRVDACWFAEVYVCKDYPNVRDTMFEPGYDFKLTRGYHAVLEKAGLDVEELEARFGDVKTGLIALGCRGQAPGMFRAVLRPGDGDRDFWCYKYVFKQAQ